MTILRALGVSRCILLPVLLEGFGSLFSEQVGVVLYHAAEASFCHFFGMPHAP